MNPININYYNPKNNKYNTTIIITHGIAEYSKSYDQLANYLKDKGFNVVTYDLIGHGKTKGKKGYINSYEDTLNSLDLLVKEAYKKSEKVFLYGHSMGGIITNLYASSNNIDGVIITASPTKMLKALKPLVIVPKFLINNLKIKTDFSDPNLTHNYKYIKDEHDLDYFYFKTVNEVVIKGLKELNKQFKSYKTPILMIYSKSDKSVPIEMAHHMFNNIKSIDKELIIYENSFHNIHLDIEKDKLYEDVYNWLIKRV